MIFLVDQDGVVADFDRSFFEAAEKNPRLRGLMTHEKRKSFMVEDDYPAEVAKELTEIYHAPGFFLSLHPVQGSIEAIKEMKSLGHHVIVCSTPLTRHDPCVREKYTWMDNHFGPEGSKMLILTKDKTVVRGRYLVDDKPEIKGVLEKNPEWEQVIFDAPYNRQITGKLRIESDWSNWREILLF